MSLSIRTIPFSLILIPSFILTAYRFPPYDRRSFVWVNLELHESQVISLEAKELKGRRKIYTDETKIDYTNVITVLQEALITHTVNAAEIRFLLDYEKGIQPILNRKKEVRPEINIKLAENNAAKITDFKIAYEFGCPITYIQRVKRQVPENNPDEDDMRITALNEMLLEESKASKDVQLARYIKICGIGHRMIRAKEHVNGKSVFDVLTLNPLTTFVVYSNDIHQKPMLAVTYHTRKDGNTIYGCYTNDTYYEIENGVRIINGIKTKEEWKTLNGRGIKNIPSIIPIVEYVNNYDRTGCFEKVISILDAINIINSDRVNDIAQHVQSLLWLNNAELPEEYEDKIHKFGILQTKSTNNVQANVSYVQNVLNQSEVQTLVDYLQRQAMEIAGVPMRQENSGGGSTGSAMNLSSGWQMAETMALNSESIFEQSERQSIKIMLEIIKRSIDIPEEYKDLENLSVSDVQIKHGRNKIYDIATKVNAMSTMLKAGIDAKHAIETVSLFTDPQAVYNDSKDTIAKIQATLQHDYKTDKPDRLTADMSDQPEKSPYSNI